MGGGGGGGGGLTRFFIEDGASRKEGFVWKNDDFLNIL